MMLLGNLTKGITGTILGLMVLLIASPWALAVEPHEDPETAQSVFSGISLLRYYSTALDFVLQKNPEEVKTRLEKMPLANIPQTLQEATAQFTTSGIDIAYLLVAIDKDWNEYQAFLSQFRVEEASKLAAGISNILHQASSELNHIEQSTVTTGKELVVSSAPLDSDLRQSYNDVLDRIDRIRQLLLLYQSLLESTGIPMEEFLKSEDIIPKKLWELEGIAATKRLEPTSITLTVQPITAFVGDNISFEGVLTSGKNPLAGRDIDILLNSSQYTTVATDSKGRYQGSLQIPYWYVPELELQALYYPRDEDIGFYLASLSPVIKLPVLFYETKLTIITEDTAYPGLTTMIMGNFDYGQHPPPRDRKAEIYLNDILVTEFVAREAFAQKIEIEPELNSGEHVITVSVAPAGRYSPVTASVILEISRATPLLDIDLPRIAMIPSSIQLGGRLYSAISPLGEALIHIGFTNSQIELISLEDGTFNTEIGVGMGFGLIGSQDLLIEVLPIEPWHASLVTTSNLVVVNTVNCGGILIVVLFFSVYLPRKWPGRLGIRLKRKERPAIVIPEPEPSPTYSQNMLIPATSENNNEPDRDPRERIFYWYRWVVRLIQRITRVFLTPQQTLREFAYENSNVLGSGARYFIDLTKTIERLLYSQYQPTEQDVHQSRQLSDTTEEGLTGENI